jgi:hypothetical protein
MYKGWAIKLALAPRPLKIYCASPLAAAMIITVAALRIVLACFTLHSMNATLAIVPQRGAGLWIRWRRYVPPKCRFTQDLHGATSQKTAFFTIIHVYT